LSGVRELVGMQRDRPIHRHLRPAARAAADQIGVIMDGHRGPLPPNAQSGPYMATVTCAPAGPCVAAGDYADTSGHQQGLLLTGSGSSWTAAKAPVPANASADPVTSPESAACASPTECFVAGEYDGPSSDSQPLLETWSGSSWAGSEAPLPADAQDQGANLDSVICASVSECFVVGEYDGPSGGQPLVLTWSG